MRDRPQGVAVAHRMDIRINISGFTGSEGTIFFVPFFICIK
jgi:hypothetical protein